jgi:nicotine blue oxidoreductase
VSEVRIAGIVLAAGASRRLGTAKQLLPDENGRAMVVRAAMQLRDAGCDPVLVITGAAHDLVSHTLESHDVTVVYNPEWSEGMGSSIRRAMEWLDAQSVGASIDAVIIAACDMPAVTSDHVNSLLTTFQKEGSRVASRYDATSGRPVLGIPALFPKGDWSDLRALSGDRGARDVLARSGTAAITLPSGDFDLDTPEDVERWRSRES